MLETCVTVDSHSWPQLLQWSRICMVKVVRVSFVRATFGVHAYSGGYLYSGSRAKGIARMCALTPLHKPLCMRYSF